MTESSRKRKLVEVALPLDEINAACKADKDRKTGTIRNLHKWFAPMPLPAWRALIFAALIDDPEDDNQRVYLLDVIKRLVENGADLPGAETLEEANALLRKQFPDGLPTVMDPFCGGGSTLVEAQRLGLPSFGSDLNPVPALISRTLTELAPQTHGLPPLHVRESRGWSDGLWAAPPKESSDGYRGLSADVRHYAQQVLNEAAGRLNPKYAIPPEEVPVAWLWGRTVTCPNPACGITTVLTTSWWLSQKKGDLAWIEPTVVGGEVILSVKAGLREGSAPPPNKIGRGASFTCLNCGSAIREDFLIAEGHARRIGLRLTAVAVERLGRRTYREATSADLEAALSVPDVDDFQDLALPDIPRWFSGPRFGFTTQRDMYTARQLLTLSTFADLVEGIHAKVLADGGTEAWADTVTTLLALSVGQLARASSTQSRWRMRTTAHGKAESAFGRNDLPLMWDFAETYFAGGSVGDWMLTVDSVLSALRFAPSGEGRVVRADARTSTTPMALVATDPPYFDAIGYADLSDYFYVWHRRILRRVHPDLYSTVATPKSGELTAVPSHHGNSREAARKYFIEGFTETFKNLQRSLSEDLPMIVVYASKEQRGGLEEETRWSSILTAMIAADLEVTGTWPIHGTGATRMVGQGTNAVASYIFMVCRPRPQNSPTISLADLNRVLRRELGPAVRDLQAASILPVDLAQAALGPGMQIYSRYRAVLDQAGNRVPVEHALRLINDALGEVLDEQEGELDAVSRFAVRWWDAFGWDSGSFGEADKTARPLGIGVDDVVRAQVATGRGNKVQLLGHADLDDKWAPSSDIGPTAWEAVHHLAKRLIDGGGELEASRLMASLGNLQDPTMELVYRLHDIAAKNGRTADQERYNALINSWAELVKLSSDLSSATEGLF